MGVGVLFQLLNTAPPATVEIWREPESDALQWWGCALDTENTLWSEAAGWF